jgi:hypothetical protein
MHWRNAGILMLGLAALGLTGCASTLLPDLDARRWQCRRDDRLAGTWSSGVVMSQLGPGFERVTYNCDCSYKARSLILMLVIPLGGIQTGWYTSSEGVLVTESGRWTVPLRIESSYRFEGDRLVVQEGTVTIRYRKVRSLSCRRETTPPPVSPGAGW